MHGYNLANRLTSVSSASSASYAINALGQRVAKTVDGVTTRYVYDEQGRLIGEYDQAGNLIQETVWLDDLPIATLRPTGSGTPTPIAVYYVHADHLGSPRAITRPADDAIVWKWDNAEPFGANAANENPSGLGNFRYDLRFPGQQYDQETGTNYNYFRDYDPAVGRYLQSDPLPGLLSAPYTFVLNRPTTLTDQGGAAPDQKLDCSKWGFPSRPGRCQTEQECWEYVNRMLGRGGYPTGDCQRITNPFQKFACIRCAEAYEAGCPGLSPAPSCDKITYCAPPNRFPA